MPEDITDEEERRMIEDRDLRYIWRCNGCGYEYEDRPGYNEALPCPDCGGRCEKAGESYT